MRQIVPDVYLIEGLRMAHAYLLTSAEGLTMIDTGGPGEGNRIVAQFTGGGYALSDLRTIVLTHCHSDHTGNVVELVRRSGAQVLAHRAEIPYLEGIEPLPFRRAGQRLLGWLTEHVFRVAPFTVERALEDGDAIDALGGLEVIHVPGHTPGSIALYQPERRILFSGDAIHPPLAFSVDVPQARASERKLIDLSPDTVCFGHHRPIAQDAAQELYQAAE